MARLHAQHDSPVGEADSPKFFADPWSQGKGSAKDGKTLT